MERAAAEAAYEKRHEKAPHHDGTFESWHKDRSTAFPYRYNEGVTIGVAETDLAPDDAFTTEASASPLPPSPGGEAGEKQPEHED